MKWSNLAPALLLIALLLPNLLYARLRGFGEDRCPGRLIHGLEQVGRYGVMVCLVFDFGFVDSGFSSRHSFAVWAAVTAALVLLYWSFWGLYAYRVTVVRAMALAVIPILLFFYTGICTRDWATVLFAVPFAIGHSVISWKNATAEPLKS